MNDCLLRRIKGIFGILELSAYQLCYNTNKMSPQPYIFLYHRRIYGLRFPVRQVFCEMTCITKVSSRTKKSIYISFFDDSSHSTLRTSSSVSSVGEKNVQTAQLFKRRSTCMYFSAPFRASSGCWRATPALCVIISKPSNSDREKSFHKRSDPAPSNHTLLPKEKKKNKNMIEKGNLLWFLGEFSTLDDGSEKSIEMGDKEAKERGYIISFTALLNRESPSHHHVTHTTINRLLFCQNSHSVSVEGGRKTERPLDDNVQRFDTMTGYIERK